MRALGDELGLARAAYLMSDLAWLTGDPVASYAPRRARCSRYARRAGSDFDAATALVFMAWCLVEGPWPAPEAIARCDELLRAMPSARGRLSLLGCRAVLMAMIGRYDEARADMDAGAGRLRRPAARPAWPPTSALLVALAETLAGDAVAAERAVRDAEAMVAGPGDRWYQAMVNVDLAHDRHRPGPLGDAAAVLERIEAMPAPCDVTWVIKRHIVRARLAAHAGDSGVALAEAEAAVAVAEPTSLLLARADAQRALADAQRGRAPHGRRGGRTAARARAGRAQGQPRRRRRRRERLLAEL